MSYVSDKTLLQNIQHISSYCIIIFHDEAWITTYELRAIKSPDE